VAMKDDDDMLDDDLAMEEWMAMTDEQQDAFLNREMKAHEDWYNALSTANKIRVDTRNALRRIMENRERLRRPELCTIDHVVGLWKEGIRRNQRRLVKIRIWRSTGIYPGEA
jgi:arsenate reductase-like glutaredoxin family protein